MKNAQFFISSFILNFLLINFVLGQTTIKTNDLSTAYPLCYFEDMKISKIIDPENEPVVLNSLQKLNAFIIINRPIWFVFSPAERTSLSFTLTPNRLSDDIDFVIFQSDELTKNPEDLREARFMATGVNKSDPASSSHCLGVMGLKDGSSSKIAVNGCTEGGSNFLAPLSLSPNKVYYLLINNYSSERGFYLDWDKEETISLKPPSFYPTDFYLNDTSTALPGVCKKDFALYSTDEVIYKKSTIHKIFPIPAHDILQLEISNKYPSDDTKMPKQIHYYIINDAGQVFIEEVSAVNQHGALVDIDIAHLIPGSYFIYYNWKNTIIKKQFSKF